MHHADGPAATGVWWEGDGEQVEFADSTRLSPLAPRADCRARPACAAVLDGAGLLSPRR